MFDKYIAHRGLHGKNIPENSLKAFERAAENGFAIELDLRLTADGKLVVFHDPDLMRMCSIEGNIREFTYEQLTAFGLDGTNEKIPLFKDVLKAVDGRVPLLIELKNCDLGILEKRAEHLLKGYKGKYAVQSFDPRTVLWFRIFSPHTVRGLLVSKHKKKFDLEYVCRRICAMPIIWDICKPDFIAVRLKDITPGLIRQARDRGMQIFTWTVRSEEQLMKAYYSADHIIFENYDDKYLR